MAQGMFITNALMNISLVSGRLTIIFFLLAIFGSVPSSCSGKFPRISYENGAYNNILIALHPQLEPTSCKNLIAGISSTFTEASEYLSQITGQRASFGPNITILIPSDWRPTDCVTGSEIGQADVNANFEIADVKISATHPIAMSLPWAEQHQGCGKSGESIFIPPSFLTAATFSEKERGQILLHEWLKFRYGVFEEYGFYGDSFYSPCYKKSGQLYFTSCTNPRLSYLNDSDVDVSPEVCKQLVASRTSELKSQLLNASSSIMFSVPITKTNQIPELCLDTTHNEFVNSKQNVQCYRKSTSDIIMNHADFKFTKSSMKDEGSKTTISGRILPQIQLVKHYSPRKQAYAFVIENSQEMRQFNRMRHVKQSIAEFFHFIDEASEAKKVFLITFNGVFISYPDGVTEPIELAPDLNNNTNTKQKFLSNFPDTNTSPIVSVFKFPNSNVSAPLNDKTQRSLHNVFRQLDSKLKNHAQWKWNVFLFTSQPPSELDGAVALLKTTPYSISAITFDTSVDWLKWNTISQTRKVLYLPVCSDVSNFGCSASTTSSLLTDHLLEILGDQEPRRFFQKITEVEAKNNAPTQVQFSVPQLNRLTVKKFLLTFPSYSPVSTSTSVSISSPSRSCGSLVNLLNYDGVLVLNSSGSQPCEFEGGLWQLNVNAVPIDQKAPFMLRGFIERDAGTEDLVVLSTLASDLSKQLFPSMQNMMVPIHVAVKNKDDHPIVEASVEVNVLHSNASGIYPTSITLLDDGLDPDATKSDGVYSSFLYGYSSEPSFHTGSIRVTTTAAQSIEGLKPGLNQAALLDNRLSGKCCGSVVPADTTSSRSVGAAFYSSTLPSFRTGESIPNPTAFPPSRIQVITKVAETTEFVQVQFSAPKSDFSGGRVDHYDICALKLNTEELCMPIGTEDCFPVSAGQDQQCKIFKEALRATFLNSSTLTNRASSEYITITCGIRGVNIANWTSPLSTHVIEMSLLVGDGEGEEIISPAPKCESISDDCLPLYIFWILIGCVAAMLLAIIIIVACWCYRSRRGNTTKDKNPTPAPKKSKNKNEQLRGNFGDNTKTKGKSDGNFASYDNEFDTKGLYRSPERDSPDPRTIPPVSKSMRRASVSSEDIPSTRFRPQSHHDVTAHPVHDRPSSGDPNRSRADMNEDEMPVFFSNGTVGNVGGSQGSRAPRASDTNHSSFKIPRSVTYQHPPQPQNERDWRADNSVPVRVRNSQYPNDNNRNARRSYAYSDQTDPPSTSFGVPSISSQIDMQMSNEDLNGRHEPMYASVNRHGRRNHNLATGVGGGNNRHSGVVPLPPNNAASAGLRNSYTPSHLHPNYPVNPPKPNSRPQSSQSLDSGFVRGHSPNSLPPPIRMDHFPSSESETYSEMSRADGHGNSVPPPPPPPMPTPKALATAASRRRDHYDEDHDQDHGSRSMDRMPPKESRFGVLAQMGPIPDRKSVLKPRQVPPPPPRASARKTEPKPIKFGHHNAHHFGDSRISHEDQSQGRDVDGNVDMDNDNDSDTWDVYDEFDFNPGVSHV